MSLGLLLVLPGCAARAFVPRARIGPPVVTLDLATPPSLDVPDLGRKLSEVFGPAVRIAALTGSRGLRIAGPAEQVAKVQRLLARPPCDPPPAPGAAIVSVIPLRYVDAATVLARLPSPLPAGSRVEVDRPTNSLVVVAPPDVARRIRARALRHDRSAEGRARSRR
jgi:hypothetical protein